jgi:hypothetical protein
MNHQIRNPAIAATTRSDIAISPEFPPDLNGCGGGALIFFYIIIIYKKIELLIIKIKI